MNESAYFKPIAKNKDGLVKPQPIYPKKIVAEQKVEDENNGVEINEVNPEGLPLKEDTKRFATKEDRLAYALQQTRSELNCLKKRSASRMGKRVNRPKSRVARKIRYPPPVNVSTHMTCENGQHKNDLPVSEQFAPSTAAHDVGSTIFRRLARTMGITYNITSVMIMGYYLYSGDYSKLYSSFNLIKNMLPASSSPWLNSASYIGNNPMNFSDNIILTPGTWHRDALPLSFTK